MPFLTLEDVNGTIFSNQGFYWYELDLTSVSPNGEDFDWTKIDFCEVKKTTSGSARTIYIKVYNSQWTKGISVIKNDDSYYTIQQIFSITDGCYFGTNFDPSKIILYMGNIQFDNFTSMNGMLAIDNVSLTMKQLLTPITFEIYYSYYKRGGVSISQSVERGYNLIKYNAGGGDKILGYLLVNLLKSDFRFDCTDTVIVGKPNKVLLGVDDDYKPNGDMIGEYEPVITVTYNGDILPVYWDSVSDDYCFDLDLTSRTKDGKIRFTVDVDENEVINTTSTVVTLNAEYETIDTYIAFKDFISIGGTGRLGTDITLLNPLTINNDVYIIGNDHTLDLNGHQLILKETRTLKADNTVFTNGINAIHQKTNSKVVLNECTFTDCTGTGSCIECDIELHSLEDPNDFDTTLTKCSFDNNDMCILHGGDIEVTECTVNGKISNPNYPYFLYITDGNATLLRNDFNITSDTTINHDIEFNGCIFICGETAIINGHSHTELQQNNITSFLEIPQNNQSHIDLSYYYDLIEDNITLQSDKGYCHSVSGVDFVFKTNVNINRGE
jgi:hypothetical protein